MYPLLQNSFLEEITKNRAYILARELAKIKGEAFVMPETSAKYGTFVDNGNGELVYASKDGSVRTLSKSTDGMEQTLKLRKYPVNLLSPQEKNLNFPCCFSRYPLGIEKEEYAML